MYYLYMQEEIVLQIVVPVVGQKAQCHACNYA